MGAGSVFDIVPIVPARAVLDALAKLRPHLSVQRIQRETSVQASAFRAFNTQVNRVVKKAFENTGIVPRIAGARSVSIHRLRGVYAVLAVYLWCPPDQHEQRFIQHYLSHVLKEANLPHHLAHDLVTHPATDPRERLLEGEAVALFADISGFTPMSEALGALGPAGTEDISRILNHYFSALIDRITQYGGSIGKIAGDALLAVFPCTARTRQRTLRRAGQCALDMQALLPHDQGVVTQAGTFPLTMKVGIGHGTLVTTTVGDPTIRLEYVLAGTAIEQSVAAEHITPKGAVVLAEPLTPLLGRHTAQPVVDGFVCLLHLHRRPAPVTTSNLPPLSPALIPTLGAYLPPSIAHRLAASQQALIDEHRTITVLFVQFSGLDVREPAQRPQLHAYLAQVTQLIHRYDGYLRQIEIGDKGSVFIAVFGAPQAHEDDAERAVRCALDLRELATTMEVQIRMGMATGKVFCGLIGSERRLDYAAVGDTVNTAARLMSAAEPGRLLLTATTRQAVPGSFAWREVPPLTLKGKREPLPAFTLDRRVQRSPTRLRAPSYALPMVGRASELALGKQLLAQTLAGQGQLLSITADAGMGKSRLVTELMRHASKQPITYVVSECLSYATTTNYLVWQSLFCALFGFTAEMNRDDFEAQVHARLSLIDSTLVDRAPLLNVILGTTFPDTDWTRTLDAKLRKSALHVLLISCLRFWAQQRSLLLILEDCHWLDELSRDLLTATVEQLLDIPVMLIVTARPDGVEPPTHPLQRLRTLPWVHGVALTHFTVAEAAQLITLKMQQLFAEEPPPPALVGQLHERAQGNPFYLDELLNLLHDRGVDVQDPGGLAQIELPDTLQRLIQSRIDQLAEGSQLVLKVASIVGRLFRAQWLWGIYPQLGSPEQVMEYLEALQQQDLTQLERREPELEYLFKHLMTRDVAYESLTHRTRATLHEQIGHYIEQTYADERERYIDLLAYHFGASPNIEKQRLYFRKAAQTAAAAFANMAAITYYERVLPLLEGVERVEAVLGLCEVQSHIGQWEAAERHVTDALALAHDLGDDTLVIRGLLLRGANLNAAGYMDRALPYLEHAHTQAVRFGDQGTVAKALHRIGAIHFLQGRLEEAIAACTESARVAAVIGDTASQCEALNNLGVFQQMTRQATAALPWLEEALAIATTANEQHWLAGIQQNLMITYMALGHYKEALRYAQRSLAIALQIGATYLTQYILLNMALLYEEVGMGHEALLCAQAGILVEGTRSSPRALGWGLWRVICAYHRLGQAAEAERLAPPALQVCRTFTQPYVLALISQFQAQAYFRQQCYAEALSLNDEALAAATQSGNVPMLMAAQLLAVRLKIVRGELDRVAGMTQLEALRDQWPSPAQQAEVCDIIWQLDPSRTVMQQKAAHYYREAYTSKPHIRFHERYAALTGQYLPPPPQLQEPPPNVLRSILPLDTLIARAEALLAEQAPVHNPGNGT